MSRQRLTKRRKRLPSKRSYFCNAAFLSPRALVAGMFFFVLSLVPAAATAEENPRHGDAFVVPAVSEPSNLIPHLASDSASAEVSQYIFSGLLRYDGNLELIGELAEGWWVLDDGMRIVFRLRKNAKWHDGEPVTPDDVVYTWEQITGGSSVSPYKSSFDKVDSVIKISEEEVEIRYREPFSPGLASWTIGILPKHLPDNPEFIGAGPYKFKSWNRGTSLELAANSYYYFGRPNIDRVIFKFIPDAATAFMELQNESLDSASLTPLQFSRQTDTAFFQNKYRKYRWRGLQYTYLGFNIHSQKFTDQRVRKALALAINTDELIQGALMGFGRKISGPFLPESWAANPMIQPTAYNPEAAKALLREAGYDESNPLSFTLLTNTGNEERKTACELIQQQLEKIGVKMQIQIVEWQTLLSRYVHAGDFEAIVMGWNLSLDPDVYGLFHSSQTAQGEFNFISYANSEVDQLLEEARREFDRAKRSRAYFRIHEIIADEQPYVFLYSAETLLALHTRFQGVSQGALGIGHDFAQWYVEKPDRLYGPFPADE